jgi:hypothetical protein
MHRTVNYNQLLFETVNSSALTVVFHSWALPAQPVQYSKMQCTHSPWADFPSSSGLPFQVQNSRGLSLTLWHNRATFIGQSWAKLWTSLEKQGERDGEGLSTGDPFAASSQVPSLSIQLFTVPRPVAAEGRWRRQEQKRTSRSLWMVFSVSKRSIQNCTENLGPWL